MKNTESKGERSNRAAPAKADLEDMAPGPDGQFEALLQYLERTRGFDFTAYKQASLSRRIQKRMSAVNGGMSSYADYTDYLEVHPEEFSQLFNTILINVTDFFRDPQMWEFVQSDIVPRILERKQPGEPVRVWSAGCASGEEAYTAAMLLADAMGLDQFRERVKIYGTDADEEALNQARQAAYTQKQVEAVPPEFLEKYFDRVGGRFVFNKELRRSVIFGRHDLIQDAPISRVDLIICRNTLMYFNSEAQNRVLARFAFALNDGGYIFLGKAEALSTRLNAFTPIDLKRRIFAKVPRGTARDRLVLAADAPTGGGPNPGSEDRRLREAALDADLVAHLIVDVNGFLVVANEAARALFNLTFNDLGRPLQDLEVSYRPVELRSLIQKAYTDRHPAGARQIEYVTSVTGARYFDLNVIPLFDLAGNALGAKILYPDVTRSKRLQDELQQAHQELETAYEELQSANEELETTNEELQSANEELETTNEELQSTNEELETMNEEMQSTNEELEATNEQLHQRGNQVNALNTFNEIVINHMLNGMIVVNGDLQVTAWNKSAQDLWGLRADEVLGKHLLNLDIGLPVEQLRQPLRTVIAGERESDCVTIAATNRRGKSIQLDVTISPLQLPGQPVLGFMVMMEEKQDGAG